jgi:hypothetical protein
MFLPPSANIPWRPDEAAIRGKGGYVINEKQVEYIKQLIKSLQSMYSDISNAHNSVAYRNSGTATVANGTTSIAVAHGLTKTPVLGDVSVTPTNNMGNSTKFWTSAPTSTGFTINVDINPGATTATFSWRVQVLVS